MTKCPDKKTSAVNAQEMSVLWLKGHGFTTASGFFRFSLARASQRGTAHQPKTIIPHQPTQENGHSLVRFTFCAPASANHSAFRACNSRNILFTGPNLVFEIQRPVLQALLAAGGDVAVDRSLRTCIINVSVFRQSMINGKSCVYGPGTRRETRASEQLPVRMRRYRCASSQ